MYAIQKRLVRLMHAERGSVTVEHALSGLILAAIAVAGLTIVKGGPFTSAFANLFTKGIETFLGAFN